jgi:hypothetical protein
MEYGDINNISQVEAGRDAVYFRRKVQDSYSASTLRDHHQSPPTSPIFFFFLKNKYIKRYKDGINNSSPFFKAREVV